MMRVLSHSDLPHYTYGDYLQWEGRWEVIDGIAYAMSPAPSIGHQQVSQKIARLLDEAVDDCEHCYALLPVDWKITDDTIVQPDNLVVCYEPSGTYITCAPSLIFEVLSPLTRQKDEQVKYRLYEAAGVNYYCLVDPEKKLIKAYYLNEGRTVKTVDTENKPILFEFAECQLKFDCSQIWQ